MAVDGGEVDDDDDGDDVDSAEHHRLVESLHEELPLTRVAPEVPQGLGAGLEGGLRIAHAPILNWLELSEITYEDIGNVPECVVVGVEGGFAEEAPLRLLEAKVHAREERAADEGYLVHDEEHDAAPLLLELAEGIALELVLPCRVWDT